MLMCLGRNIRKFFTLLDDNTNKSSYWQKPTNLKKEYFPYVKPNEKKEINENFSFHYIPNYLCFFIRVNNNYCFFKINVNKK